MVLSRSAIISVIGRINRLGRPSLPVSRKLIKGMKRSDLILHRILGVGMFGRVWLVQRKASDAVYALKVMDKKGIIEKKMSKGVMREKVSSTTFTPSPIARSHIVRHADTSTEQNVMSSVEHPFIVDLVATFQDHSELYMLLSYVQGGEVSESIDRAYCCTTRVSPVS